MLEEEEVILFEYRNSKNSLSNFFSRICLKFLLIDIRSFSSGKFGLNDNLLHRTLPTLPTLMLSQIF